MTMRTVPDLKELFKQASEIAQQVPPNMQEAAFNRALDLLTAGTEKTQQLAHIPPKATRSATGLASTVTKDESGDSTARLLNQIDSTQHPGVISATKILDRALMVLKIALDEHGMDGLTPASIATVLTDKFRVSASSATVGTALSRAPSLVNRVPNGGGFSYRIMAPGQAYLNALANPDSSAAHRAVAPRGRRKATPKPEARVDNAAAGAPRESAPRSARRGSAGTLGPKPAVLSLIAEGYFDTGRTVQAMQAHLKTKKGFSFDPTQLRVALLRLVRDRALDREENSDKEYEYKRK